MKILAILVVFLFLMGMGTTYAHQLNKDNSTVLPQVSATTLDVANTAVFQNTSTAGTAIHSGATTLTGRVTLGNKSTVAPSTTGVSTTLSIYSTATTGWQIKPKRR